MAYIISKRDGPRKEDIAAKAFLNQNRATIAQLKQCLTGGMAPPTPTITAPPPDMVRAFGYRRSGEERETAPYLRLSPNGRVVVADFETGRQLHHLGDIRGSGATRRFVLATRDNGYFTPLKSEIAAPLADLDGRPIPDRDTEAGLSADIANRLGLRP